MVSCRVQPSVVLAEAPLTVAQGPGWSCRPSADRRSTIAGHPSSAIRVSPGAGPIDTQAGPGNDWRIAPMRDTGPAGTVADDETST